MHASSPAIGANYQAVVLIFAVLMTSTGAAGAQGTLGAQSPPVRHEISGGLFIYQVAENDSSDSIAARFGEPELTLFPDGSDPEPGDTIMIDNRHVAAAAIDEGIVINVPQRMLFVFREGHLVEAWPITVGRPDWPTPLGGYKIASLSLNPTWHVPIAIRDEMEDEGMPVSAQVKPGPANPLGKHWIGLDHGGIGIHGTNHPRSIFHFGSHGCIRLAPDSVNRLFRMVRQSEQVEIVYEPVALAALADGRIFIESDSDPYEQGRPDIVQVHAAARAAGIEASINWVRASRALVTVEGIARRIDLKQPSESTDNSDSD